MLAVACAGCVGRRKRAARREGGKPCHVNAIESVEKGKFEFMVIRKKKLKLCNTTFIFADLLVFHLPFLRLQPRTVSSTTMAITAASSTTLPVLITLCKVRVTHV